MDWAITIWAGGIIPPLAPLRSEQHYLIIRGQISGLLGDPLPSVMSTIFLLILSITMVREPPATTASSLVLPIPPHIHSTSMFPPRQPAHWVFISSPVCPHPAPPATFSLAPRLATATAQSPQRSANSQSVPTV